MITDKTSSGFEFTVSEKLGNNYEFVKAFKAAASKNPEERLYGTVDLVKIVLGDEGEEALCDYVREEDGSVPTDRILDEIGEIIRIIGEKNAEAKK